MRLSAVVLLLAAVALGACATAAAGQALPLGAGRTPPPATRPPAPRVVRVEPSRPAPGEAIAVILSEPVAVAATAASPTWRTPNGAMLADGWLAVVPGPRADGQRQWLVVTRAPRLGAGATAQLAVRIEAAPAPSAPSPAVAVTLAGQAAPGRLPEAPLAALLPAALLAGLTLWRPRRARA